MNHIESTEFVSLLKSYPHIEEKAVVDFINGFSVMSDHLGEKRKLSQKSPLVRLLDHLTGQSNLRQGLIDASMEASLIFLKDYVVANEKRLSNNEVFLDQIMGGVSLLSAKLQETVGDTVTLRQELTELTARVDHIKQSLGQRIDYVEHYNRAMAEVRLALSIFETREALFSPEQSLWMLLTRLKYGEFGTWIQTGDNTVQHQKNVLTAMQTLKNNCMCILSKLTGRSRHQLVDRDTLFAQLSAKDELLQDALCLVSDHDTNLLEPVMLAVNSGESPILDCELPYVFSNSSIYDEMSQLLNPGEFHATSH